MKNNIYKKILLLILICIIALSFSLSACNTEKYTVWGYVLDYYNSGIGNVTLEINGISVTTDNNGFYTASDLKIQDEYTVKIIAENISYEKTIKKEEFKDNALTHNIMLDVKNTYSVSGVVLDEYDNFKPISNVEIEILGTNYKVTTDNEGKYTLSFIPINYDKTVFTFSKDGYMKTTQSVPNSIFNENVNLNVNLPLQTIFKGKITNSQGDELQDVRVTVRPIIDISSGRSPDKNYTIAKEVLSDSNGNYIIGDLDFICVSNEYTIRFEKAGYTTKNINLTVTSNRIFLENILLD